MTRPLTKNQRKALSFVARYSRVVGYPPTLRDICRHIGAASTNAANDIVVALIRRGLVTKQAKQARTLLLTDAGRDELAREAPP